MQSSEAATIAVIEDHESSRKALVRQINAAGFNTLDFASAVDFLHSSERAKVDCVVADVHLPAMDGLRFQEELRLVMPHCPIVFITGHPELAIGMQAMRQGATDFLEKPVDEETLLDAIRRAVNTSGERYRTESDRKELERRCNSLTPREREVFVLITRGLLNKQVAAELGTAERTVKAHRSQVMKKMGADSLAELVRSAAFLRIEPGAAPTPSVTKPAGRSER